MAETLEERVNRLRKEGLISAPAPVVGAASAPGLESLEDRVARLRKTGAIQAPAPAEESLVGRWAQSFGNAASKGREFIDRFGTPEGWKAGTEALNEAGVALAPIAAAALLATPLRGYAGQLMRGAGQRMAVREGARGLARVGASTGVGIASGKLAGAAAAKATEAAGGGPEAQEFAGAAGDTIGIPGLTVAAFTKLAKPRTSRIKVPEGMFPKEGVVTPPRGPLVPPLQPGAKLSSNRMTEQGAQEAAENIRRITQKQKVQMGVTGNPITWGSRTTDKLLQNLVEAEAPITRRMKRYADSAGFDREQWNRLQDALENAQAVARRPNEPLGVLLDEAEVGKAIQGAGKADWGDLEGLTRYEQRLYAKIQLDALERGAASRLPTDEVTPNTAARAAMNRKIIQSTEDVAQYEPYFQRLANEYLNFQVKEGMISAETAAKIKKNGAETWVKQIPILTEEEKLKYGLITGRDYDEALVGAGSRKPQNFLNEVLEREAKPVIQATFQTMQAGIKQAAKNRVLRQFAMEAAPGDAGAQATLGRVGSGIATDMVLYKKPPTRSKSLSGDPLPVFIKGEKYWLDAPPDFAAGARLLGAEGLTSLNNDLLKKGLAASRLANRTFKAGITGFLNLGWQATAMALNLGSVAMKTSRPFRTLEMAIRSFPEAFRQVVGAGENAPAWVKEGRMKAAFGTSSEVFRGQSTHDLEIQSMLQRASRGAGLGAQLRARAEGVQRLAKWGLVDPLQEGIQGGFTGGDKEVMGRALRLGKEALTLTEDVINMGQSALSMGAYRAELQAALDAGMGAEAAAERAAWVARNFMADYTRRGSNAAIMEILWPYYNAITQGVRSGWMAAGRNPKQMAKRAAVLVMPLLAGTMWNYADPEMAEVLDMMGPEERAKYLPVRTGKLEKDENGNFVGGLVKITVPEEMRLPNIIVDHTVRTLRKEDELPEALYGMAVTMLDNLSPVALDFRTTAQNIPLLGTGVELELGENLRTGQRIISPKTVAQTPKLLRDTLGPIRGTKAWYATKKAIPALRQVEEGSPGPLGRFTEVRAGRQRAMKQKARREMLERLRYGDREE